MKKYSTVYLHLRVYIPQKKEGKIARGSLAEYLNSRFMAGE